MHRENVYLHDLYVFNEAGQQVETGKAADENQRFGQIIYNIQIWSRIVPNG